MKLSFRIILLASGLSVAPALAAPASIGDCESIKGADAYNYCLASFGPRRGGRLPAGGEAANPEDTVPQGQKSGQRTGFRRAGNLHILHPHTVFLPGKGAGGRMTMQFSVGKRSANAK